MILNRAPPSQNVSIITLLCRRTGTTCTQLHKLLHTFLPDCSVAGEKKPHQAAADAEAGGGLGGCKEASYRGWREHLSAASTGRGGRAGRGVCCGVKGFHCFAVAQLHVLVSQRYFLILCSHYFCFLGVGGNHNTAQHRPVETFSKPPV